jgi:ribonuclease P protein component
MDFSFSKNEKLKSRKVIDSLFKEGKSVSKYPLRLVYIQNNNEDEIRLKVGVSVSKKHFKNAVDRNYFKRVLRECYRLNKSLLLDSIEKKYSIMFFYQTRDRLSYDEINQKTIQLFEKFILLEKENKTE